MIKYFCDNCGKEEKNLNEVEIRFKTSGKKEVPISEKLIATFGGQIESFTINKSFCQKCHKIFIERLDETL